MTIIEYKLDPQDKPESFHPKTIPSFVTDGGHWFNPDNFTYIAMIPDEQVPESITTYTLAELQARQRAIHAVYPMDKEPLSGEHKTEDEINAVIKAWVEWKSSTS